MWLLILRLMLLDKMKQYYIYFLGKYTDVLSCAQTQLQLAKLMEDNALIAESHLSLARSYQYLCNFNEALHSCTECLDFIDDTCPVIGGYIMLYRGDSQLGLSHLRDAVKDYTSCETIAKRYNDTTLLLKVYLAWGQFYLMLMDFKQSMGYFHHAARLSKSFHICDVGLKMQKLSLCYLAQPYLKMNRLPEATQCCQVG